LAESGFAGAFANTTSSPGSSVTYYGNYGSSAGAQQTAETTEANASLVHRGSSVTLKNLRVVVTTNTRAATSSVTTRKNAADSSQVASITSSTTGVFTDLSNNVSLTAADTVGYKLIVGSTSGNLLIPSISADYESASQSFGFWSALGSVSTTNASATRHYSPVGRLSTAQTAESMAQAYAPAAGTISNLRAYVTAARATATTLKSRVGGADGAQSVSITGTGAFEDTTNSDSVSAASLFNVATVTGGGSDTLTISSLSYEYTPSTAKVSALGAGPGNNAILSANATRYFAPVGTLLAQATETNQQIVIPYGGTLATLAATVSANASTTTATMVLRLAESNTALTFTIAGGATGSFADTSNSVAVSTGDLVSVQGSGADGSITFRSMSLKLTAAGEVVGTAAITEAGDTLSSATKIALKAAAAITEAGDTVSSASTVALKASAAITEADDTLLSASRSRFWSTVAVTTEIWTAA
jgi:hypothetical protein